MEVKIILSRANAKQRVYLYPEKDRLRVTLHDLTPKTHKITRRPKEEKQLDWEDVLTRLNVGVENSNDAHWWAHVLGK